jgi:hypothetical protein
MASVHLRPFSRVLTTTVAVTATQKEVLKMSELIFALILLP